MDRNDNLFRDIARVIDKHPALYDQDVWGDTVETEDGCGTSHCIAGWAAALSGWEATRTEYGSGGRTWMIVHKGGKQDTCSAVGRDVLGLTDAEARILFDSDWEPPEDMTVPEALEKLATGADIRDVTVEGFDDWVTED